MSYWYCPNCKIELDGCHVTYEEKCEYCGSDVLSVPETISQEELDELIKAKADGRLVVLPCKIGEKVYRYCNDAINEGTIINILLNVKTGEIGLEYEMPTCYTCSRSGTLGKNLFLTREAAEKALGGMNEDAR